MKVTRTAIEVRHRVSFPKPAVNFATQSARLLDALVEEVAVPFSVTSNDVTTRNGARLSDWSIGLSMFNGFGKLNVTVDGFEANYSRLANDKDVAVVTDVQRRVFVALARHSPTQKYLTEALGGSVHYRVVGGPVERDNYFKGVSFPGRNEHHQDVGFKMRMRHPSQDIVAAVDIAPLWADPGMMLVSFDIDMSTAKISDFAERAKLANELLLTTILSCGLEPTE